MVKIESFSEVIFGFVIKMAIKDRIRRLKNDITYGRDGEMAQKVIEGDHDTWQFMHLISRWLKIQTIHFSPRNIDHVLFFCQSGSLF